MLKEISSNLIQFMIYERDYSHKDTHSENLGYSLIHDLLSSSNAYVSMGLGRVTESKSPVNETCGKCRLLL